MRPTSRLLVAALALGTLVIASSSEAQVLYRRPYDPGNGITAGFDNNGSAGGCADYECGGACYDGHTGTDFGVPFGTPVLVAATGTVTQVVTGCPDYGYYCSPCGGLCGNHVRVRHADGSETLYCHMQSGGMTVQTGQAVTCGQTIGHSATSGCSTGAHLHFGFYPSSAAAAEDPFRGACGGPVSRWTSQGSYGSIPGTSCACVAAAETCNGVDDDCDSLVDEDDVCEIALLNEQPVAYAPPATTDVDGDGRADLCARGSAGVACWPAGAGSWQSAWGPIALSDANGWDDVTNYATLRMGDLDGDGRADLCARSNSAFECTLSTGTGFGSLDVWRDGMSDANGWGLPQYYTTLRLADVNADGRDDLCARDSAGFGCWLSNGTSFDQRVEGPRWSDAAGFGSAKYYGTLRMGDVNGDRRADVCIRGSAGVDCVLSDGSGFVTSIGGPEWSDAAGFGAPSYWSTMRLADVNGDGRDDLCIRTSEDLRCALSTGTGFEETAVLLGMLSNANGWADVTNYATFRTGDIDGDGRDEICARGDAEMGCWSWNGTEGVQLAGPAWSDATGWGAAQHYETIRLADFDGDGRDDLCARAAAGWRCHPSSGKAFGDPVMLDDLTNAGGWGEQRYWSTILSAGPACVATDEVCNGLDDDCDGEIDEGMTCWQTADSGVEPEDGGVNVPQEAGLGPESSSDGGCGCRTSSSRDSRAPALPLMALALALVLGRRAAASRARGRSAGAR
ncbi:MAG: VCBS repeat domain-containing M23 family metallopeptidase [Sorangiineae bacterium]|nr:VCBS repeat domain-containing M23 family metallopeptidase [Polyangiaceae bacterium]MEB2321021.1 VCBS repeat domain-containing M23 family metallopeptidase [Sorangiineae bacterium]